MITKDSNGTALPASYATTVQGDNRQWLTKLSVNGTELNGAVKEWTVTKGASATPDAFTIGSIISSTLNATFLDLTDDVRGKEIQVEIGLEISGVYKYITLGYFTCTEVSKTAYTTTITAYGNTVTKTGVAFVPPATPSLANIAGVIATDTGCTVTFDAGITTSYELTEPLNGFTDYQMLQILAELVGGYAVDTNDGNIAIHKFSDTSTLSVGAGLMVNLPRFEEENFEITGVEVIVSEESTDEDGTVIPAVTFPSPPTGNENLIVNNQFMTADIYTNVFAPNLVGYEYRPANIGLSVGDPRIEGNDVLTVTDVDGTSYIVPCHMVTHRYDGGLSSAIQAVKATAQDVDIATSAPITQRIDAITSATISAQASAEQASQYAQQAKQTTDEINAYATLAGKTVTQILNDGETAGAMAQQASDSAEEAMASATSASNSANSAQYSLSEIEQVVDVLNWISAHGTYVLTSDTEPIQGKFYFEYDNGAYISVTPSEGDDPSALGLYELDSVSDTISNYVASHITLDNNGLVIQTDNVNSKVRISGSGVQLTNGQGEIIATFSSAVTLGNASGTHIKLSASNGLEFWNGDEADALNRVAYINSETLKITKAEIETSLRIGKFEWRTQGTNRISLVYVP